MKLSKQQFEQFFQENRLVLSFIGMSNIGKSYWAKQLSGLGFRHINCDDLIEAKLAPALKKLGYSGIEDVARWMGQPFEERFAQNQQKYLSLEKESMENIFSEIQNKELQNFIIDTTGSLIYTGHDVCTKLKQCSLVVYIEATENMKEEMFQRYIEKPKPVVFGDVFQPKGNESTLQTLKRCYPQLLDLRSKLYAQYADVVIPHGTTKGIDVHQFLSLIKKSL